jgi:hypothetical protein
LNGLALFVRVEELPFAPFIELAILDDVLGKFKLEHAAWHNGIGMFLCLATVNQESWSLATRLGHINQDESQQLDTIVNELMKVLSGLIKSIRENDSGS